MASSNESSDAVTLPSSSTKASKSKRPERSDEDDKAVLRLYLFPTEAMDFCSVEEASKEYEKFTAVRVPKQTVYSHLKYELESPCYSYSKLRELRTKFEDLIKGSQHHADFQSKLQNLQEVTESVMK